MRLFHFSLLFTVITGFNTSEEDPNPSHIPYTDSDSDLASPSLDGSSGVSRLPDIFGSRAAHALRTARVRQGGGPSGSGDKTRLYVVPQESKHNGQEKAGTVISDLAYSTTPSLTDSTLSLTEKERDSSLSNVGTQWPGLSVSAVATASGAYSNTHTDTLPEKAALTTKTYSDIHDDTDTPLVGSDAPGALDSKSFQSDDITVMSSAHTVSEPRLTTFRNGASVTELEASESRGFLEVTVGGDVSVMSSPTAAHRSSETSSTDRFPYMKQNHSDLSVTEGSSFLNDSVSEFNSVTYTSDGVMVKSSANTDTAEIEASRTNRLPRSTINGNVSNHTHSSLFGDSSTMTDIPSASVPRRQIDASTLSDSLATTDRKSTESYSYTPYYTNSPNTDSTPADSAPTQASHTVHREPATVREQTTDRRMSDANTPHTSSEILPTRTDSPSTPPRRDFTSTSASYSAYTLGQSDPFNSTTLQTRFLTSAFTTHQNDPTTTLRGLITAPYDANLETKSSTEVQTHDDEVAMTSDSNNPSRLTTLRTDSRPTIVTHHTLSTSRADPASPPSLYPAVTPPSRLTSPSTRTLAAVTTSAPPANLRTSQTTRVITTTRLTDTRIPNHLTTSRNTPIIQWPDTTTTTTTTTAKQVHTHTHSQPGSHTPLTHVITQTSSRRTLTTKTEKDWSQRGRVFITEDQPAVINVKTFQVLLQVILEENPPPHAGLVEVEPFLQNVAGFQSQHVTWRSGSVLQSVVTFRTEEAVSWLGRAESLLQEAGLKPLPSRGVFVSAVRVKNITVGGLHSDVCSQLFSCPSDFDCVSSVRNVTCRSVCHSEYCKNHGICVHRPEQQPVCQCPVGEDFWFMGQRCDLRMTRQRLVGVCLGVLAALAALMGLLAYLAVQRFKKTLIQAKAEQTQSSYRRFNHFDELSARFWRRSWPGSEDSLDNTAFSRSDELLHMRALDRACCYHDDTLSIASTYPDSATHLKTVYPHGSQYHWDMSMCSLADGVIDSGKASDLSVCSWPIEPIQWTPFPLLQQLRNANTIKPSRPRSYCEGMELVGLEKSRTA